MKFWSITDKLGGSVHRALIENVEEIDGEFFRLLEHWGQSWTEGVISILGSSPSKDFTDHLQNYASKEKKWITSSVQIRKNARSGAFCLQVVSKKNSSEVIYSQCEPLQLEENSRGNFLQKPSSALVILDLGILIVFFTEILILQSSKDLDKMMRSFIFWKFYESTFNLNSQFMAVILKR
jgi:hypothetical protein